MGELKSKLDIAAASTEFFIEQKNPSRVEKELDFAISLLRAEIQE